MRGMGSMREMEERVGGREKPLKRLGVFGRGWHRAEAAVLRRGLGDGGGNRNREEKIEDGGEKMENGWRTDLAAAAEQTVYAGFAASILRARR